VVLVKSQLNVNLDAATLLSLPRESRRDRAVLKKLSTLKLPEQFYPPELLLKPLVESMKL
jgi:hypothetical protein